MRGQLSVEFIIVLTGMLLVVAAVSMPMHSQARSDAEKMTKLSEAREAANTLAGALNNLYAGGPGSRVSIKYSLPQGVVSVRMCGYEHVEVDGLLSADEIVPINGRADVQILLDLDGDGLWDNRREAAVVVDTILPSRWHEDATERGEGWVEENCVHVEESSLIVGPAYGTLFKRTFHFTSLAYFFDSSQAYLRTVVIQDETP